MERPNLNFHARNEPRVAEGKRTFDRAAPIVFCVALGVRLICLAELAPSSFLSILISDGAAYDKWAQSIAAGDVIGHDVFYQAPLYPYFLGVSYAVFGRDTFAVRVIQILLDSAASVLLLRAGEALFTRRVGWIAGLAYALYPPAVFFSLLIQKTAIDSVLMITLVWLVARQGGARTWRRAVGLGIVAGILALTRENALVLIPVLAFWQWVSGDGGWVRRGCCCAAFLAAAAAVLLPVSIRNYRVGGEFVLTTAQFGPNFYYGNHRGSDGTYAALVSGRGDPLFERLDAERIAESESGRQMRPSEVSDWWARRAMSEIREDPRAWLRLMWRKWMLVWNYREIADSESIEAYSEWSRILRGARVFLSFGVVVPLAAVGVAATWSRRRQLWIYYAIELALAASVAAFFVFARYRASLVPIAMLFAAAGCEFAIAACLARRWRALLAAGAVAVPAAVFCNWRVLRNYEPRVESYNNYGMVLALRGEYGRAIEMYRRAARADPNHALTRNNLGVALMRDGRLGESIVEFEGAVRLNPRLARAHRNLGTAYVRVGRVRDAEAHLEQAIRLDPKSAESRELLDEVRRQLGS